MLQCFDSNGQFDVELFLLYRRSLRKRKAMDLVEERLVGCYELAEDEKNRKSLTSGPSQKRSVKALAACYTHDANREIFPLSPCGTVWYHYYVLRPPVHDNNFQNKFRRWFRLPYEKFLEVFAQAKQSPLFRRWTSFDAVGKESSPIELMILEGSSIPGKRLDV